MSYIKHNLKILHVHLPQAANIGRHFKRRHDAFYLPCSCFFGSWWYDWNDTKTNTFHECTTYSCTNVRSLQRVEAIFKGVIHNYTEQCWYFHLWLWAFQTIVTNVPFLCTLTYFTFLIYLDYCHNPYLAIYYVIDDFVLKYRQMSVPWGPPCLFT